MTKREMFNLIATVNADNAEIVEFCEHELSLLDARKSSKKGMTATQKANVELKEVIADALVSVGVPTTISDLQATDERLREYSNQKLSALLRQMVSEGKAVKSISGKKAYFEAC